jgi:hypothetical protein
MIDTNPKAVSLSEHKKTKQQEPQLNFPAEPVWIFDPQTVTGGGACQYLNEQEAAICNEDPDLFAASCFNLTKEEYFEWLQTGGYPTCGGTNKDGSPCKKRVGSGQLYPQEWKRLHRNVLCPTHTRPSMNKRDAVELAR